MERTAFSNITKILSTVVENYKTDDLQIVATAVTRCLTGDRDKFKDIDDVKKAIKGIKFNSKLLKLLFDDGVNPKNLQLAPNVLAENMLGLSKLQLLFEDIGNNQICEYKKSEKALENNFKVPIWCRKDSGSIIKQQRFFKPIGANSNEGLTNLEFIWLNNDEEFP